MDHLSRVGWRACTCLLLLSAALLTACIGTVSSSQPQATVVGDAVPRQTMTVPASVVGLAQSASPAPLASAVPNTAGTTATPQVGQLPAAPELILPSGFRAEVYARGLHNPTALAWGPDGKLYITQLNGEENAATGQVVVIDHPGAPPVVVLEELFKPTGLVWREQNLYIVAGRDIVQTGLDQAGRLSRPMPVVDDLPFNTRSEGQIDLLPDGRLLFEASGDLNDPQSGRLLTLIPGEQPRVMATGLKNAYAHAIDPTSGEIYTTDIHEEPLDGQPPLEEINVVLADEDYGWPYCNAQRVPATNLGGTARRCAETQPALVTLPPHTTPTGLTLYDGADFPAAYRGVLYVALWNGQPPQVMRVVLNEPDGQRVGDATTFLHGLERPIDLLPDPQGGLLVLDYGAGVVYRVLPAN